MGHKSCYRLAKFYISDLCYKLMSEVVGFDEIWTPEDGNPQDTSGRSEAWPLHPAAKNGVRIQERISANNTGHEAPSRDKVLLC
jgi:hypothetical protein